MQQSWKAEGFLDPKVLSVDTNTLLYQVPGGMLSNLISQLKQAGAEDKYYDVLEEIPRVRKDFGYPPLVTPTSQIVGSQAVLNVLSGERYKMVTKESKGLLRGEYGRLPGEINTEVQRKAIGDTECITCRPADLLQPELEHYRKEAGELAKSEEDVLSYALFPQVAKTFLEKRNSGTLHAQKESETAQRPRIRKIYPTTAYGRSMSTMHPVPDYCSPPIPAELSGSNHDKGSCDPRKGGSFSNR